MKTLLNIPAAATLLASFSLPVQADRASVLLGSHHFGGGEFEEFNPGIFYTWERQNVGFSAGVFRNSYGRGSVAATAAVPLVKWDNGEFTLFAGAAYYRIEGRRLKSQISSDVIGIGGLQVRQGHAFAQLIPMNDKGSNVLISFGFTWDVSREIER